jgi:membrane associated rhomboid family serine protease
MIPLYDDQPGRSFPVFTVLLILVNLGVFAFWQLGVGLEQSVALAALTPFELSQYRIDAVPDLFSSMFMHASWMHLIGNMWFLWIFGNNVEDATGHFRFLLFYLLCGVLATLAHVVAEPNSIIPLVGASGAVSGVLGAYLVKHPTAYVRTIIPLGFIIRIADVPAYVFLLIWIGLQIFSQAVSGVPEERGGVAYLAHIGGFVAGILLIFLFQRKDQPQPYRQIRDPRW